MVKITPKVRTILLCLLLIGSCFTTYAFTNLSFLTPSESDTNVSSFKVSKGEQSSLFQNFSVNNFKSDPSLYTSISERAIARFNPSLNSVNSIKLLEVLENQNLLLASSNFVAIPTITLGNNSTATVCHGATSGSIPYTTTTGNPNRFSITYKGTALSAGFLNVVLADLPTSPKHVPIIIPSSATPGTYTADLTVSNQAGERATAQTITIVINPKPTVTTANTKTICSGSAISISLTASVTSSFSWTLGSITGNISGASAGSGSTINQTLTNPSNTTVGSVQYIVTPTSNTGNCVGSPYTITVSVNPSPSVTTANSATICSGSATNISLTASVSSSFTWTIGTVSGGITGAGAGSGSTINQTLINPSNTTAGSVQYIVTPTSNTGECVGSPYTITVNVNPKPTVTTANSATICSGSATNISLTASVPSSFTWTIGTISGGITGASAGSGSAINQTLNNSSNTTAGSVQYLVTPTSNTGECVGSPYTITVTVNPKPTVTTANSATICSGSATNISLTASVSSSFTWTIGTVSGGITGAGAGSGSTINQTLINPSNTAAGSVQYIVTPTSSTGSCEGSPYTITVNVNPKPTVTTTNSATICSGTTTEISLTASIPSSFTWTAGTVSGGISGASAGSGSTINQTLTNSSNSASGSVEYIITPTSSTGSCEGSPYTITVNVNPITTFTKPTDIIACNGETIPAINFTGATVSGSTFSWTNDNPSIALAASGTGNIPTFTATNTTSAPITRTITVTPTANGCEGTPQTFTIKVNPSIVINPVSVDVTCNGEKNGAINITSATGGNGTLSFSLDNINFDTNPNINNLYAGIYTLYVKDAEVCTYQIELEITEPEELSTTPPSSTDETCFSGVNGVHDGTITAGTINGGSGVYQYSIDNSTFQESPYFSGLAAGNYTIFIQDENGCSTQSNVSVGSLAEMKGTLTKTNINCFNESTGAIKINNPTGGTGSYEYQVIDNNNPTGTEPWVTTPEITNLPSGDYKVNIRDVANIECIVTLNESYILTQPTNPLTATVSATRTLNFGSPTGTATATPTGGSGGYTYEWRVTGQNNIIQTTQKANSLAAGDYEVTVVDSNGCRVVETVTIVDIVKAEISETSRCLLNTDEIRTSSFQVNPDLTVGGIGDPYNYTYVWDFGANSTPKTKTGLDRYEVKYNTKGDKVITLTVTDEAGIVSTQKFDHYVGGCFEGCVGQNSSQDFQIDKNNYFIGDINGTRVTTGNCSTIGDKYLWIDILKSVNVYVLDVELIYSTTETILTGTGIATDSGQLTGCFGTIDTNSNGNGNQERWKLIPPGLYPLFKVDSAESNTNIEWECGEGFTVDQIRIRWTTNSGKECGDATGNSCIDSKEIVSVSVPIFANIDATDTPCFGTALGSVTINAYGGVKPYTYSINGNLSSNYVTTKEFYNLTAGTYNDIWVKDSKGETYKVPSVTINEPQDLELSAKEDAPIICFGDSTSATAVVSGGTTPYTYVWNDGKAQTTATAVDLSAGSYTVTVTDANDCQEITNITIVEPTELTTPAAGQDQSFNCGIKSTTLQANTPEIGVGKWVIKSGSGGSLSDDTDPLATFSGNANITYLLEWTIANADGTCLKFDEVSIAFTNDCSSLDFDGVDDHVNFGDNYNLSTGNFTFEVWVKPNAIDGIRTVLSKRNASNLGSGGYDLIINNGAPTFRWGNISVSTSSKLTTSRWHHLAISYNGDKYYLYVDGIDVGSKTGLNPVSNSNPFILGAMNNNTTPDVPSNYFNGWIEELRIWNSALSEKQLHLLMNQRLLTTGTITGNTPIRGDVLPIDVPDGLTWNSLKGYYQLKASEVTNGITLDITTNQINGILKNIESNQDNSAPLPYTSGANGIWSDKATWSRPDVWSYPNAKGINDEKIDWNIAETSHNITSGGQDLTLIGLNIKGGKIKMYDPNYNQGQNGGENENNPGQGLIISHYLRLDGNIYLIGDSQLLQPQGSILEAASSGFIKKDQQGTASSYNYNYWSSPVVPQANAINSTYTVASVLKDGSIPNATRDIDFGNGVTYADGAAANPRKISNYWIYKFRGKADEYSDYQHIGSTGILTVGEGFTMKGTSGNAAITDRQNYVFKGKPNNGDITLTVGKDQNYLLGNPYPSALDANKFILDNLSASGGTNTKNIFNGALYFWDHFGGKTHTLREYVGGYATYNLIGGVKAIATDDRINSNTDAKTSDENVPGQFIPVGQGFFINTVLDDDVSGNYTVDGGDVVFRNSQRAFKRESPTVSHFLSQEKPTKNTKEASGDAKIRLDFKSPLGYLRQILVGTNEFATNGFDLGYDAPLNDYNVEDFFWLINDREFVIQGVSNFDKEQVLPVGMYISQKGKFSIEIYELENIPDETEIYLKDIEKDKYYDLRDSKFEMEIESGDYFNRFEIVFSIPEDYNPNAADEESDESEEDTESKDDSEEEGNSGNDTSEEESSEETDNSTSEESEENSNQTVEEVEKVDDLLTEYISILDIDIHYMSRDRELSISNPFLLPIKRVEIYNLLGQQIQKYIRVGNQKEIRLPVSEYATGIYVVKLYSENSQISKNIMLKQ